MITLADKEHWSEAELLVQLGFIQGVLWSENVFAIQALMDHCTSLRAAFPGAMLAPMPALTMPLPPVTVTPPVGGPNGLMPVTTVPAPATGPQMRPVTTPSPAAQTLQPVTHQPATAAPIPRPVAVSPAPVPPAAPLAEEDDADHEFVQRFAEGVLSRSKHIPPPKPASQPMAVEPPPSEGSVPIKL